MILRVALPLFATCALVALLAHRRRIATRIGRNPVVIQPFAGRELPHRYRELVVDVRDERIQVRFPGERLVHAARISMGGWKCVVDTWNENPTGRALPV
jgi:hypothetical protein